MNIEDLSELMHTTYETAAIRRGWYADDYERMPWSKVPDENQKAIRDTVTTLEQAIREDERSKNSQELVQADLRDIMRALGISLHARNSSPHEVVQNEILPKLRKVMQHTPEAVQADLMQIMLALEVDISKTTSTSPHDWMQKDILPKIHALLSSLYAQRNRTREVEQTLAAVKRIISNNYTEITGIIDESGGS